MLMQNFQSAADLEISEAQKEALMKTLVLLETGKLKHCPTDEGAKFFDPVVNRSVEFTGGFNMKEWSLQHPCGTISCIAGTAEIISGVDFSDYTNSLGLIDLFTPYEISESRWHEITTEQAARALRSYLTTGDAKWTEAVSVADASA